MKTRNTDRDRQMGGGGGGGRGVVIFMEERDGTSGRTLDYRALEPESCGVKVSLEASGLIRWPLFFVSERAVLLLYCCVFSSTRAAVFFSSLLFSSFVVLAFFSF